MEIAAPVLAIVLPLIFIVRAIRYFTRLGKDVQAIRKLLEIQNRNRNDP